MNLLEEMQRICAFLLLGRLLSSLEEGQKNEKYIAFVIEVMVLFSFFRLGISIIHYILN